MKLGRSIKAASGATAAPSLFKPVVSMGLGVKGSVFSPAP